MATEETAKDEEGGGRKRRREASDEVTNFIIKILISAVGMYRYSLVNWKVRIVASYRTLLHILNGFGQCSGTGIVGTGTLGTGTVI